MVGLSAYSRLTHPTYFSLFECALSAQPGHGVGHDAIANRLGQRLLIARRSRRWIRRPDVIFREWVVDDRVGLLLVHGPRSGQPPSMTTTRERCHCQRTDDKGEQKFQFATHVRFLSSFVLRALARPAMGGSSRVRLPTPARQEGNHIGSPTPIGREQSDDGGGRALYKELSIGPTRLVHPGFVSAANLHCPGCGHFAPNASKCSARIYSCVRVTTFPVAGLARARLCQASGPKSGDIGYAGSIDGSHHFIR